MNYYNPGSDGDEPLPWVKAIIEEGIDPKSIPKVGKLFWYQPDDSVPARKVKIMDGQFYSNGGVSNF